MPNSKLIELLTQKLQTSYNKYRLVPKHDLVVLVIRVADVSMITILTKCKAWNINILIVELSWQPTPEKNHWVIGESTLFKSQHQIELYKKTSQSVVSSCIFLRNIPNYCRIVEVQTKGQTHSIDKTATIHIIQFFFLRTWTISRD